MTGLAFRPGNHYTVARVAAASLVVAIPLLSMWGSEAGAINRKDAIYSFSSVAQANQPSTSLSAAPPLSASSSAQPSQKIEPRCSFIGNSFYYTSADGALMPILDLHEAGERRLQVCCKENYAFVITTKNIWVVYGVNSPRPPDATPATSHSKLRIADVYNKNLVASACSENEVYLLTANRELRRSAFPFVNRDVNRLPFNVHGAKMAIYKGVHVAAPGGNLASFSPSLDRIHVFKLSSSYANPSFSATSTALLFGSVGSPPRVQITVANNSDVTVYENGTPIEEKSRKNK